MQCRDLQFSNREDCRHCGAPRTHSPEETSPSAIMDAEQWLEGFVIDEAPKQEFLDLSPERQQIIILKGPLKGCRDPTAVLVSRLNALPPDPEAAKAPHGEYEGRVKSYSVFKGFGFIYPANDDEPDIFLHFKSIADGSVPSPGDILTFDLESSDTGVPNQMKAVNIRGGTGYPLTAEQKGKDKDKGKGKGSSSNSSRQGKSDYRDDYRDDHRDDYGARGRDGPYGKGYGGGKMMGGGCLGPMAWSPWGCGKGWDCGPGWDCGKGCVWMPVMKGPPCGKGWDFGKGPWDGGKMGGKAAWGYGW